MSDINNTNAASSNPPPRRLSFSEKIAEKFSIKNRRNSGQSQQNQQSQQSQQSQHKHQYGTNENAHDSAFAVEGSIVGAHAIPPISLERRYWTPFHSRSQGKTQNQAQSPASAQIHGDQHHSSGSSNSGEEHLQHHTEGQTDLTEGLEDRLVVLTMQGAAVAVAVVCR
ncbi:hypothetical protein EC991_000383 [Linnemannia zychae]|nr:hypothetical protein EC991_000383 [Linnemannia zychae]